jgi:hypothetical protein
MSDPRDHRPLDSFLEALRDAPREYTLIPFWFWNDALDEREIIRQMDDFADHGVYGVVLHPRLGLPRSIGFLSDRILHFVRVAVEYAARRGLIVHLYDEGMYPSGSACGRVVAEDPRLAARCLLWRPLADGEAPPPGPNERLVARAECPDGTSVALYDAPSFGRIRGVHEGQDDGEPDQPAAADLLNPATAASFIRHVHERYFAAVGDHFGTTVRAVFTDEPDLLGRRHRPDVRPWTTGLEEWLSRRLGYDVRPRLPLLWFGEGQEVEAFRRDFQRAIAARLQKTYYRPLSEWCAAHGIALTGHPAGPEDIGALRDFQLPGQDVVWRYVEPGKSTALEGPQSTLAKCAASAAAHHGRARCGVEAFGAYGWEFTWEEMVWLTDWLLVRGVNLIWPHAFYYSLRDFRRDERPPDVGPNNAWWPRYREYADYVRRLCHLIATSSSCPALAILCESDRLPWRAARVCFEHQHDFRYLEAGRLRTGEARATAEGVTIEGISYSAVLIDGATLEDQGVGKALGLAMQAGRVAIYEPERAGAAPPVPAPLLRTPGELIAWLDEAAPSPLRFAVTNAGSLRCLPLRCRGAGNVLLLFNEGEAPVEGTGDLTAVGLGKRCWMIDPWTLAPRGPFAANRLPLSLRPHETLLVFQAVETA